MKLAELDFLKEIDLLKNVERQTLIYNGDRRENSAEHSWHLASSILVLKKYAINPINLERALLLALYHDIVEIDGGDTFVYSDQSRKADTEFKCLNRLTGLLPVDSVSDDIKKMWLEYEENSTFEAQFVNAIDRFLPIYANYISKGHTWKKYQITKEQVIERNREKILRGVPVLWETVEDIMRDGIEQGYLKS